MAAPKVVDASAPPCRHQAVRDRIDRRAQVGRKDGRLLSVAGRDRHAAEVGALVDDGMIMSGLPESRPVAAAHIALAAFSGGQSIAQRIAARVTVAKRLISQEM